MKRLSVWIVATTAGVVLLFSYHTSTSGPAGGKVVAGVAPVGVVTVAPGVDPPSATTASSAPTGPRAASPRSLPSTSRLVASPRAVSGPVPKSSPAASARPTTSAAAAPSPAPKQSAASTRTINGAPADTRYGPVQVQVKVRGSRIISADAIVYPTNSRRDEEINSQAIPQLDDETLQAQSAQIDTVSGASYTSDGYRQSLQSALDAAHL